MPALPQALPQRHTDNAAQTHPDYFTTLDALQQWASTANLDATLHPPPSDELLTTPSSHAPPRRSDSAAGNNGDDSSANRPKLLVCHDFQGGYTDHPSRRGYTFEHWHLADTFIYFAHHRISCPPAAWMRAAKRHGTSMLGTVIFEWSESVPSLSLLLRGPVRSRLPHRGAASFSPFYADLLVSLALSRGMDGWLINVEVPLDLGFSASGEPWPPWVGEAARRNEMRRNAERLRGWVGYLRRRGEERIGPSWTVVWYDSVTSSGDLAWQDAVTPHNAPFLAAASAIFTNYTWARPPPLLPPGSLKEALEPHQQRQIEGFGLTGPGDGGWHPALQLSANVVDALGRRRDEAYVGIDVFGRNCYGGNESWRSLDMVVPRQRRRQRSLTTTAEQGDLVTAATIGDEKLGLGVALFAPGWTWEHDEPRRSRVESNDANDSPRTRTWEDWWKADRAFWTGLPPHRDSTLIAPPGGGGAGPVPLSAFFPSLSTRRDRLRRLASPTFYTTFSLGSGERWFASGRLVGEWRPSEIEGEGLYGWTDAGTSMPQPDLLASSSGTRWEYDERRAWSGGGSFLLYQPDEESGGGWEVPLCSAALMADEDGQVHVSLLFLASPSSSSSSEDFETEKQEKEEEERKAIWPTLYLDTPSGTTELEEVEDSRSLSPCVKNGEWKRSSVSFYTPPSSSSSSSSPSSSSLLALRIGLAGTATGEGRQGRWQWNVGAIEVRSTHSLIVDADEEGGERVCTVSFPASSASSSSFLAPTAPASSQSHVNEGVKTLKLTNDSDNDNDDDNDKSSLTAKISWQDFDEATAWYDVFLVASSSPSTSPSPSTSSSFSSSTSDGQTTMEKQWIGTASRSPASFSSLGATVTFDLPAKLLVQQGGSTVEVEVYSSRPSCSIVARCAAAVAPSLTSMGRNS